MSSSIAYRNIISDDAVSNAPALCCNPAVDLAWPGVLIVEQKNAGRDRPRQILASDFRAVELHGPDEHAVVPFPLADLARCVEASSSILGVRRRTFRDQDAVKIDVAEPVGRQPDILDAAGYRGHDPERWTCPVMSNSK